MEAYYARVGDWLTDHYGHRWREGEPRRWEPPGQVFYEEMYRRARAQLQGGGRSPKSLRKYWQKQLWTARACLESYFGAAVPED